MSLLYRCIRVRGYTRIGNSFYCRREGKYFPRALITLLVRRKCAFEEYFLISPSWQMGRSRNSHGEMHQPCNDAGKFRFAISSVNRTAPIAINRL